MTERYMWYARVILILTAFVIAPLYGRQALTTPCADTMHGCVKMGKHRGCDDGEKHLEVDWDKSNVSLYQCGKNETILPKHKEPPILEEKMKAHMRHHICMQNKIEYPHDDRPPTSGPHRPVWPNYGRYLYMPPQRWLHSLEHGAIVFLYHPCANYTLVAEFLRIAEACLNRRVSTPYRDLPPGLPFAVLAWRNKLLLNVPNERMIASFVRNHALRGPETIARGGGYNDGLISHAPRATDPSPNKLCPRVHQYESANGRHHARTGKTPSTANTRSKGSEGAAVGMRVGTRSPTRVARRRRV